MSVVATIIQRLEACPAGISGWKEFESACTEALTYLFVPPLSPAKTQSRTFSGIDRRDAVFPNRNMDISSNWGRLQHELAARLILFEFKNYDKSDIGKDEVNQTRNYLNKPMGKLAIVCSNILPDESAHIKRNTVFSEDGKVILFITVEHIKEMLYIKERGEDPSDFIMDSLELFYLQHE